MLESVGHPVVRLRRVRVGPIRLGALKPGAFRDLTREEVRLLERAAAPQTAAAKARSGPGGDRLATRQGQRRAVTPEKVRHKEVSPSGREPSEVSREPSPSPVNRHLLVAIDGPSGVGKGTIARNVAARLGYRHVDTGAMYRAVAWAALHEGIALDAEDSVADVARRATIDLSDVRTLVDGHEVTRRSGHRRSIVVPAWWRSCHVCAAMLVDRQREIGAGGGVVMEGRDIGTVVFPDADVKIYLDASPQERARRRASDPAHTGNGSMGLAQIATEMAARDRADTTRPSSPLMPAADAHVIDTTGLSIDEVTERVLSIVEAKQSG